MKEQTRRPGIVQWPTIIWLTVVWCLLWGEFTVGNVVAGVVVSVLIVRVLPLPPLHVGAHPHPGALLRLLAVFAKDVVASSIEVARLALRAGTQPTNAVLVVPLRTRNEFALFVTAEMVSLVPGSLLIEASRARWTLQVHVINVPTPADVEHARERIWDQERRVVEAIGSPDELERVRQAPPRHEPVAGGGAR